MDEKFTPENRNILRSQAGIFKALGHESRLLMVRRLFHGECTVGELTALVGLDTSTVSKHLAVLRSNGIVDDRKHGSNVYYRLLTPCVVGFLECTVSVLWQRQFDVHGEESLLRIPAHAGTPSGGTSEPEVVSCVP